MTLLDWLLVGGILLALGGAAAVCIRERAKGKTCGGDCTRCSGCGQTFK